MAKESKQKPSDGRHLISVGLPLGTVLGVLILGALLQSGPSEAVGADPVPISDPLPPPRSYVARKQPTPPPEHPATSETAPAAPRPAAASPTAPPPRQATAKPSNDRSIARLGRRALEDVERLSSSANRWTGQVGVYCDVAHVSALLERFQGEPSFYVLPAMLEDRACFRVCWGRYESQDQARQGRDLPEGLRGEGTFPRRISSVIQ